jgi:hypothetical protein
MELHLSGKMRVRKTGLIRRLHEHGFRLAVYPNPVHDTLEFLYAYRQT